MNPTTTTRINTSFSVRIVRSWGRITVIVSLIAIPLYFLQRYSFHRSVGVSTFPLWVTIVAGGLPLLFDLSRQMWRRQFGSDFLAGLSIVTATLMGELLVATIIVLMLSGGQALEEFATRCASSVLSALAGRTPSVAHRIFDHAISDIPVDDIRIGDRLIVFPHEICPVDGVVESGTGTMDESFLTGEPFASARYRDLRSFQALSMKMRPSQSLRKNWPLTRAMPELCR